MSNRGMAVFVALAALVSAGCASEDYQQKYEEQQKQNLDLAAENDELKQARAEQSAKVEQFSHEVRQTEAEALKARQAADALAKQNEELRNRLAGAQAPAKPAAAAPVMDDKSIQAVANEFQKERGVGGVSVTKDGNIEILLSSDVTFASGSAELSESGKKSLRSVLPLLKDRWGPYQIRVEGHTDSTPLKRVKDKYQDNFGLGSARSLAVVRFMESDLGIEPTRLMSASRGQHEPKVDEKSDSGRKQNRRVEIVVIVPHDAAMSLAK